LLTFVKRCGMMEQLAMATQSPANTTQSRKYQ